MAIRHEKKSFAKEEWTKERREGRAAVIKKVTVNKPPVDISHAPKKNEARQHAFPPFSFLSVSQC